MTDETELTIAGVTSLHDFPRGLAANMVSLSESSRNGPANNAERVKISSGVIAAQRYAQQPTLTVDNGMPLG